MEKQPKIRSDQGTWASWTALGAIRIFAINKTWGKCFGSKFPWRSHWAFDSDVKYMKTGLILELKRQSVRKMVQNCIEKYSKGTKQESSFKFWRHLVTDVTPRNGLWSEIIILRENAMAAKSKAQQSRVDPISKNHPTKSDSASNGLATLHSQSPTGRTVEFWQLWCTDAHVLFFLPKSLASERGCSKAWEC